MPRADRLSPEAVELLQERHVAILSTVLPDGSPHATPVWVDVEPDGTHILINSVEGHVKVKNIDRDPRVAVTVVDSHNPFRTVQVRGIVVEKRGPDQGSVDHINLLSKKYTGREEYVLREGETRVMFRIQPTHILQFRAGRGEGWRARQGERAN